MNISEEIRRLGVIGVKSVQTTFPNGDEFFFFVSRLADPLYCFTLVIPLVAGLNTPLATDMLIVSLMAEFTNTLLKWLIMDHRPFWWVRETSVYGKMTRPVLRQTPLTCETGPGSPSGHVQGMSSVLYVVLSHLINSYIVPSEQLSEYKKHTIKILLWLMYLAVNVLVSMSRLYTATHFPHQTLLGLFADISFPHFSVLYIVECGAFCIAMRGSSESEDFRRKKISVLPSLLGMATAWLFVGEGRYTLTQYWRSASRLKMLFFGLIMIGISFGAYWLQRLLGVDPQWSVRLAFKWCEHPEWIHVSTTPLFSLVRCCGSMFGLALSAPNITRVRAQPRHNIVVGALLTLSLLVAFQLAADNVPTSDVRLFYGCQFMLHAVIPFLLCIAVPRAARLGKLKTQ